jgi:hypothetical protein
MAMHCYSQRQLGPYRGVMHVLDTGDALAFTADGAQWRVRFRNGEGRLWPAGDWLDTSALDHSPQAQALLDALERRPALPFAPADRYELWLLAQETGLPLALLKTALALPADSGVPAVTWRGFLIDDNQFHAQCLECLDVARPIQAWPVSHRDVLERRVNSAAGPLSAAQWFERTDDGGGIGLHGHRIGFDMQDRCLGSEAFPELIVAEDWHDALDASLVREYHEWNAALLLTHAGLTRETRACLEHAALRRPEQLLGVHRLICEFVDRSVIEVALVAARIECASR